MRIAVLGQGYVGLTAAVCLARAGHRVTGIESEPERLLALRAGRAPIFEPGLQPALTAMTQAQSLDFAENLHNLQEPLDGVLVAVGSPQLPSGGADLRQLASAVQQILALQPKPAIVMVKTTVPPGTSERLLAETGPGSSLAGRYVYSPEFLSQGVALNGWAHPTRIVIGLHEHELVPLAKDLYRGIAAPYLVTTPTNAEMIKYASNAFLATKITFINEIANLSDEVGASIDAVVEGIALDPRIGASFLRAGAGYGGSCFPKDTRALVHLSGIRGGSMPLLESVIAVNNAQRLRIVRLIRQHLGDSATTTVAVLGLSFKPGTDDLREAPSLTIVPELIAHGLNVRVWDPAVPAERVAHTFAGAQRAASIEQAVHGAGAAVILTEWPEVAQFEWCQWLPSMTPPRVIVDGRNCLDAGAIRALGFTYCGIGRGSR